MFDVESVKPYDDRDVIAYSPEMGLVVAFYDIDNDKWFHGYENLYILANIPHEFKPTKWAFLDVDPHK